MNEIPQDIATAFDLDKALAPIPDEFYSIDTMNAAEVRAYEFGCAAANVAVLAILDGKDRGEGTAREPWEGVRRRLLALVALTRSFSEVDQSNVIAEAAQEIWNEIKLGPRLDTPERRAERESYAVEAAVEFGFVADENDLPNGTYIATGPQIFALLEHVEKHARLPSMTFSEWMSEESGEARVSIFELVDKETIPWMRAAWGASLSRTFGRKAR